MDKLSKQDRSILMGKIKSKNSNIELIISKELWRKGFRFRRNVKDLYGKPDIAIKKYKAVIFIDSCFWHGCRYHCRYPKTNIDYWQNKIQNNKKRDKIVKKYYKDNNWNILRVWEHEILNNYEKTLNKIIDFLNNAKYS